MRWIALLLLSLSAFAHEPDAKEEAAIVREIIAACPKERALAEKAGRDFHAQNPAALDEYRQLLRCANRVAIVHVRIGFLYFSVDDFAAAEKEYRTAVKLDATFTNKLSLLQALLRENKPEANALYDELARYEGDRDDIWAGLAYAALHHDDDRMMKKASARAIALDTKWWQAWFVAALVEGIEEHPDWARANKYLDKADALGAPHKYTDDIRATFKEAAQK